MRGKGDEELMMVVEGKRGVTRRKGSGVVRQRGKRLGMSGEGGSKDHRGRELVGL